MKTGVWISLILLALTIGLGVWSGEEVRALSEEYVASAEELRTLAEAENWAGAEAALQKCQSVWKQKVPWLQTLINHDDVDAVTTALKKIEAGISSRELLVLVLVLGLVLLREMAKCGECKETVQ